MSWALSSVKPTACADLLARSPAFSAILGCEGSVTKIGRPFFSVKKRTRPPLSAESTAPQRGHLYLPAFGTSSVTRQRAHCVCIGKIPGAASETAGAMDVFGADGPIAAARPD